MFVKVIMAVGESNKLSLVFFPKSSTRSFLFPVIISTSGHCSQSLSVTVNLCEAASGHFGCSLQPLQCHCQLLASTWALPSTVDSLADTSIFLYLLRISFNVASAAVILDCRATLKRQPYLQYI